MRAPISGSLAALAIVAVAGCAPGESTGRADGSELRILYPGKGALLSPLWDVSAQHLMFLPLFELDPDGQPVGKLVESWEHSDDWRVWTYTLRPGMLWHDGVPVTAHDIQFTMQLRLDMPSWGESEDIEQIEVFDDRTLRVVYREPRDGRSTWVTYYPKHILENLDPQEFDSWDFWYAPVGNGPFRYVRHDPDAFIELEANPDFYDGPPAIDRIVLQLGGGSPIMELLSGNVQGANFLNRPAAIKLLADSRYRIYHQLAGGSDFVGFWNLRHPILADARVRRALVMALDRAALLELLELPLELMPSDTLYPDSFAAPIDLPAPYPYDPDAAARLLSEAGWQDSDGDGIRDRDGTEPGGGSAWICGSRTSRRISSIALCERVRSRRWPSRVSFSKKPATFDTSARSRCSATTTPKCTAYSSRSIRRRRSIAGRSCSLNWRSRSSPTRPCSS